MTISEKTIISQGFPITVMTVDGMDRVEINNKLHDLNVQMDKLRAKQIALIEMRNAMDRKLEMDEMGDLFDQMFDEFYAD